MSQSVRETMSKVIKALDPVMRVPFVVAIDWFLSTLDFSSVYALCKSLPALVLLIPLLFSATHDTLLFIYGFFISLGVAIIIVFSTVGEYIPSVQEVILSMEGEELIIDAILLYQGLVFMFGINNWLGNLQRLSLLTMFVPITGILCKINYGFVLGYWYFIASEAFGVHKKLRQFLHEATFLVNNIGCVNTMIYYYRNRRITLVLRLFWLSSIIMNFLLENNAKLNVYWFLICAATASNTKLRLFALALWLPEVSYNILWTARAFLIWSVSHTADDLEPRDMGKALVFYFIATFNSVLDVDIIQRMFFITLLMFISFSYILKSVYKLCDETLKALSTSLQNNCLAHVRAIVLTLLLIWVLLYTSWIFCSMFSFRIWELVIVSTDIVTAVQALTSLAIYALFLYDLKSSKKLENLDDWVYYLNAVSNSLEFISAFLVLSFGVWDCLQGSWSVFGLVVIVIHTYYNIWLAARNGWKIFLNRRDAVRKLNHLSDATQEQLNDLEDVCAICFDPMSSAKITRCGHYFHASCLRKWLYIQSSCPLCHQDILVNNAEQD